MTPVQEQRPRTDLSMEERVALVEAFERREAGAVRKAAGVAWLSLGVAALLLGILVFGAWSQLRQMRAEVAALEGQQEQLTREVSEQQRLAAVAGAELARSKSQLSQVDAELREKQTALSTLIGAVRRTDQDARGGLVTALDADPQATTVVPRAYVQIVDEGDRQWARNLSDRLQHAGVIPLGIEYVREAGSLKQFEVRYNKKAEEPGAQKILRVLDNVGVPAAPVYLNLENNTSVRRNHFEIWCPPNARQHKLPPIVVAKP